MRFVCWPCIKGGKIESMTDTELARREEDSKAAKARIVCAFGAWHSFPIRFLLCGLRLSFILPSPPRLFQVAFTSRDACVAL